MSRLAPDRVEWVYRQLVAGRDFRDALRFLDVRRQRHLRGAHATWGVALGLEVVVDFKSVPATVSVAPGLAYDASGRELLVETHNTVALAYDLTGQILVVISSSGCVPDTVVDVVAQDHRLSLGQEIILAIIDIDAQVVLPTDRQHIRRMAPATVASGYVQPGETPASGTFFAHSVTIDTRSAGFTAVPLYIATPVLSMSPTAHMPGILGPLLDIHDATTTEFSISVRYLAGNQAARTSAQNAAGTIHANVFGLNWVGYQAPQLAPVAAAPIPMTPEI